MTDIVNNAGKYKAIAEVVDQTGTMITGRTDIELAITRLSDDFVLDWSDLTFKFDNQVDSITTRRINIPELNPVNNPGIYELEVDLSTITNEISNDHYVASAQAPAIFYEAHADFRTEDADATSGFGDFTITITVEDGGAIPIPSVDIKIKDSTDSVTIARRSTDASGEAIFNLDADTYNVHITKIGYEFPGSPETLVVSADGGVTYNGDLVVIPPPVGGDKCTVSGFEFDVNGSPSPITDPITVSAIIDTAGAFVKDDPSSHIIEREKSTTTDVNGLWSLELYRSASLELKPPGKGDVTYTFQIKSDDGGMIKSYQNVIVPDQTNANLKDII